MLNKSSTYSQVCFRILICGVGLILLTEITLRIFFINPSRQLFDKDLGWQYIPNSRIVYSSEGYASHTLNNLGLNDESLASKTSNHKILLLGDSFTEALEVPRNDNFSSLLSNQLRGTDTINAGRGAYAPAHQLIVIKRLQQYIEHHQTLYFMSHGDLADLANTPTQIQYGVNGQIINMQPLNQDKDALKDRFRVILHNSALATYMMRRYHQELKSVISFIQSPCLWPCSKSKLSKPHNAKPKNDTQIEQLKYILVKLNEYAPLTVVYLPNIIYKPYGRSKTTTYSNKEIEIIQKSTSAAGVPFLNLASILHENYKITRYPAFGFQNTRIGGEGHLNKHGHSVVAAYLASAIKEPR